MLAGDDEKIDLLLTRVACLIYCFSWPKTSQLGASASAELGPRFGHSITGANQTSRARGPHAVASNRIGFNPRPLLDAHFRARATGSTTGSGLWLSAWLSLSLWGSCSASAAARLQAARPQAPGQPA